MTLRLTDPDLAGPLRLLIAALIGLSTALFVVGVTVERAHEAAFAALGPEGAPLRETAEHPTTVKPATATARLEGDATRESAEHPATLASATTASGPEGDATQEAAERLATPGPQSAPTGTAVPPGVPSERLFGLDLENPSIVFTVVLGWLALGIALFFGGRPILVLIALAGGLTTLFDLGEIGHQFALGDGVVAALAIAVTVAHGALLGVALFALTRRAARNPPSP